MVILKCLPWYWIITIFMCSGITRTFYLVRVTIIILWVNIWVTLGYCGRFQGQSRFLVSCSQTWCHLTSHIYHIYTTEAQPNTAHWLPEHLCSDYNYICRKHISKMQNKTPNHRHEDPFQKLKHNIWNFKKLQLLHTVDSVWENVNTKYVDI